MRERTSVRDRRRRPHDIERISLSRDVTQLSPVLEPVGLVGDLVVRDAAQGPSVLSYIFWRCWALTEVHWALKVCHSLVVMDKPTVEEMYAAWKEKHERQERQETNRRESNKRCCARYKANHRDEISRMNREYYTRRKTSGQGQETSPEKNLQDE